MLFLYGSRFFINLKQGKDQQSFAIINMTGYSIGNFTMPFVQSFLEPAGVITTSLFDTGNACICLGTSYGIASILKEGGGFSFIRIGKNLMKSVPLICYLFMMFLSIVHMTLPEPIISFAEIIANSNAYLSMFMIGVGFKLEANREQLGEIGKILAVRYGAAVFIALIFYHFLPFEKIIRQALVILLFSPIPVSAISFTGEIERDVGLASALNSVSLICSSIIIVNLLVFVF